MAGQPQEPWQSYSPPDPQGAPGAQGYGQVQANTRPAPGYQGQDYTIHETFPGQGAQDPQWQASGPRAGSAGSDAKGFFGALFDFGFTSFVTPKIIKALYVLYTVWMVVWALIFLRLGFKYGGAAGGIFTLIVVDPIFLLLTLGAYRVILELFMVIHRIHDDLKAIRERTEERD
jgi:hypothetical protein